ncbi:DNA (cytosine-5-)-methyltransferase [Rhizobium ruizarguesonis]|uniref:DNA cytosine methyltransferase n=1 Tax=Rhizobium ruizarguesonis TaxID=2081791 RepID=UPI0010316EAB|nr:DNA (cytosine-5-)-methyltransferase [Rhizobium ruizarguesonis]TAZ83266.1 DNA (cytosine-5-)-methyltransferase [Rhizobium ruizarguesonis]
MDRTKLLDEKRILEAADALGDLVETMASVVAKSASIVEKLDALGDPEFVNSLLRTRASLGHHELEAFRAFGRILKESPELLAQGALPPAAATALAGASNEVRRAAQVVLQSGRRLDHDTVDRLESFARFTSKTESERMEESRSACLESMIAKASPTAIRAIESLVDALLEAIEQFRWDHLPRDPSEAFEPFVTWKEFAADHAHVVRLARAALLEFERYLGPVESFDEVQPGSHDEAVKLAGTALERFASGAFAHRGGFAFEADPPAMLSTELTDALFYLATNAPSASENGPLPTRPSRELRALELCAGAGGQAIGLMSAGFRHVALYEKGYKRARTLRKNWPAWKVRRADVRKISDEELARYRDVDLLAGGPPCEPFSQAGKGPGRHHDKNLFPEMIRAVRIVRPRAFMFENVPGITNDAHAAYLASICAELTELDYKVDVVTLNAVDFGLPQERKRLVIVGIRNDIEGTFVPPVMARPIRRGVAEALGPLVIRHETPAHLRHLVPPDSDQERYDQWAESWRTEHAGGFLPTITKTSSETRSSHLDRWSVEGFDLSSFADEPPSIADASHSDFKPRFTLEMLACAQGFPSKWGFHAEGGGNFDMVGDAFPPVMAKAVGLAIYTALTGVRFDLDAALAEPLLDEGMIGVRSLRGRTPRSWQETVGADKAHRILAGKAIEDVEPNPKRRPLLRQVVSNLDAKEQGLVVPTVLSEVGLTGPISEGHFRRKRLS